MSRRSDHEIFWTRKYYYTILKLRRTVKNLKSAFHTPEFVVPLIYSEERKNLIPLRFCERSHLKFRKGPELSIVIACPQRETESKRELIHLYVSANMISLQEIDVNIFKEA